MATKNTKTSTTKSESKAKDKGNGVEAIIDHLAKHKGEIGGIVIAVTRKSEAMVTAIDGDKCDGYVLSADLYSGDPDSSFISSPTARGLACLAEKGLNRGRGFFG